MKFGMIGETQWWYTMYWCVCGVVYPCVVLESGGNVLPSALL